MKTQTIKDAVDRRVSCAVVVCIALLTLSSAANAQREHRARSPQWHGDIGRFHEHDWGLWRGGHWAHARHDGRLGWWWVVGASWYFYPSPIYPYPNPWEPPPAVLVTPPIGNAPPVPPTQYWYFCESSHGYYPYVQTCINGWKQVPTTPNNLSPEPLGGAR
jgi:hypothetical protein